ncbi:MAG TPA: DUF4159 domain-containing protein [Hyphomicrobiaceae bacterium]|nr:DUF4159 domain-containing protein [Hyphomicrobiaceae bacterium]
MSLGALTFLSPWLLAGLAALPIIYWLLRTVPPRPRQIIFPPTRILVGIENREKTPDKTPWWLMLIRLLAAALVILALAEPILNPNHSATMKGAGPVAIVVDNGWSSGAHWPDRVAMVEQLINQAEASSRAVVVVGTADAANRPLQIEAPNDARTRMAAMQPQPYPPVQLDAAARLEAALATKSGVSVVWLTDGIDHGQATAFATRLDKLASSELVVVEASAGSEPLGIAARVGDGGKLKIDVVRTAGAMREGIVLALSSRGERLSEARFKLDGGSARTALELELPLELRNQVSRVVITSESSAGGVHLLDARSRWSRVGLIAGSETETDQPLLGPLYYVRRALQPFAELVEPADANLSTGLAQVLKRQPSMLILADVGTLTGDVRKGVAEWIEKGGVLVRFAGPRLEKAGDDLLPVPLRTGGRTLGGALSWSTPQPLAAFADNSAFAGLEVTKDVKIRRQVLADPASLTEAVSVWARLEDGTPLVTAAKRGDGQIVLFHVTANSNWSDLPLSGLFVEMLRRISALGTISTARQRNITPAKVSANNLNAAPQPSDQSAENRSQAVLTPVQVLDGRGALRPPPPTVSSISRAAFDKVRPESKHPPGYYGPAGRPRALNIMTEATVLKPLPTLPARAVVRIYEDQAATNLKPWFLGFGLALLLVDVIAVLLLQSGGNRTARAGVPTRDAAKAAASVALIAAIAVGAALAGVPGKAHAQRGPAPPVSSGTSSPADAAAIAATGRVTFGYVLTGDAGTDGTSRAGLSGLGRLLTARTAVEPGEPVGVDIEKHEIAFFPILYWPVIETARTLDTKTLGKIDAYMKQGGMIIFDTRDYGQGVPIGFAQSTGQGGGTPLQRLLGKLDIPRLEPVPQGHVLTKSFYLLQGFPGRWDGGQLWVEVGGGTSLSNGRRARRADGVSTILVTPNDLASAWALDEQNRPLFPVVPGGERQREMAFRTGINIVMYALTGNYKADQVHIPALLERLGQ